MMSRLYSVRPVPDAEARTDSGAVIERGRMGQLLIDVGAHAAGNGISKQCNQFGAPMEEDMIQCRRLSFFGEPPWLFR